MAKSAVQQASRSSERRIVPARKADLGLAGAERRNLEISHEAREQARNARGLPFERHNEAIRVIAHIAQLAMHLLADPWLSGAKSRPHPQAQCATIVARGCSQLVDPAVLVPCDATLDRIARHLHMNEIVKKHGSVTRE
jgi:hypothetical protein